MNKNFRTNANHEYTDPVITIYLKYDQKINSYLVIIVNLWGIEYKQKIWKAERKRQMAYKRTLMSLTVVEARGQRDNFHKMLRKNYCAPKIVYSAKLSHSNGGNIIIFKRNKQVRDLQRDRL